MSADPGLYAHGVAWAEGHTGTLLSGGALERAALTKRRSSSVADTRTHPSLREAILLVGSEGFSFHEAAEIMGCPLGRAKSRVCRARAQLVARRWRRR